MKLKVQHIFDATLIVSQIIREQRRMPQKGKYRLARMHAKLLPEFNTANERRDEMIKSYDTHQQIPDPSQIMLTQFPPMIDGEQYIVPPDKLDEFSASWKEIGDEEIDIDIVPIPMSILSLPDDENGAIEAHEIAILGDLLSDE